MKNAAGNYWKISQRSLFYVHYAFADHTDYLADHLFMKHKVKVIFKHEYSKENMPYVIILCKVKKKDESAFLQALLELNNKMLLLGHTDYINVCEQLSTIF